MRQSQVNERSFAPVWKGKMIIEHEVDDAEQHDGTNNACCRPVDYLFSFGEFCDGFGNFTSSLQMLRAVCRCSALLDTFHAAVNVPCPATVRSVGCSCGALGWPLHQKYQRNHHKRRNSQQPEVVQVSHDARLPQDGTI